MVIHMVGMLLPGKLLLFLESKLLSSVGRDVCATNTNCIVKRAFHTFSVTLLSRCLNFLAFRRLYILVRGHSALNTDVAGALNVRHVLLAVRLILKAVVVLLQLHAAHGAYKASAMESPTLNKRQSRATC